MKLVTIDDHKAIRLHLEVAALCAPLFTQTPIKNVNLVRQYYDGKRLSLSNRGDWLMHHFEQGYYKDVITTYPAVYKNKFTASDHLPQSPMIIDAKDNFNIWHGFTIRSIRHNYIEFFHFATDHYNPEMLNWYLNNLDIMKQFIMYFIDVGQDMISSVKPYVPAKSSASKIDQSITDISTIKKAVINLDIKRWFPYRRNESIWLSAQEIAVLKQILLGGTAKTVAKELVISPRTVEFYLNNIKNKFDCQTKAHLINKIQQTSFLNDFFTESLNSEK